MENELRAEWLIDVILNPEPCHGESVLSADRNPSTSTKDEGDF
jgi:hypothetical protein